MHINIYTYIRVCVRDTSCCSTIRNASFVVATDPPGLWRVVSLNVMLCISLCVCACLCAIVISILEYVNRIIYIFVSFFLLSCNVDQKKKRKTCVQPLVPVNHKRIILSDRTTITDLTLQTKIFFIFSSLHTTAKNGLHK